MAVIQTIDNSNFGAIWKSKRDAQIGNLIVKEDDPTSILIDTSGCHAVARLDLSVPSIPDQVVIYDLKVFLTFSITQLRAEQSVEWVALLEGTDIASARFFKKLDDFPSIKNFPRIRTYKVTVEVLREAASSIYCFIQVSTGSAPISITAEITWNRSFERGSVADNIIPLNTKSSRTQN